LFEKSLQTYTPFAVQYYVVGTGFVKAEESEPKVGRILLLQLTASSANTWDLRVMMEQAVTGAVYAVCPIPDIPGRLALTVNSQVCVFWIDARDVGNMLKLKCKTKAQVVGLYVAVKGRYILVGDLMKSVGIYQYNDEQDSIKYIAKEYDGATHHSYENILSSQQTFQAL
jgi:DNA damage-binding protein 1